MLIMASLSRVGGTWNPGSLGIEANVKSGSSYFSGTCFVNANALKGKAFFPHSVMIKLSAFEVSSLLYLGNHYVILTAAPHKHFPPRYSGI